MGDIEAQVEKGLSVPTRERMEDARRNLDYYRGNIEEWRYTLPPDRKDDGFSNRSLAFVPYITRCLTKNLYKTPPIRVIPGHDKATEFLDKVYKDNALFALWPQADRLSLLSQVAAFQVAGTADPNRPIKIHLWDASSFDVGTSGDDPTVGEKVAAVDRVGDRVRYTIWTSQERLEYQTDPVASGTSSAGMPAYLVSRESHGYGCLPWSFVHFEYPTLCFWSGSPGNRLVETGQYADYRLTRLADAMRYLGFPIMVAEGVSGDWTPPASLMPGDILTVQTTLQTIGEGGQRAGVHFLEAAQDYVTACWDDISKYINACFETNGIPEAAIRMVQSVARSGASIIMEQHPILEWVAGRRPAFEVYETNLARTVLTVAVNHLKSNGVTESAGVSVAELEAALVDFDLKLIWPEPYPEIPGPERDRADEWAMKVGLKDRVEVYQSRYGGTREDAEKHLAVVDQYNKKRGLNALANDAPQEPGKETANVTDDSKSDDKVAD